MVALAELRTLVQPIAPAHERILPVLAPLDALLPAGGLPLGATVRVAGSTSLTLALVAAASQAGSWVAVAGSASVGWSAAADLGVDLARVLVVSRAAAATWADVLATLVDGVAIVVVRLATQLSERDARRLAARARERGAVLMVDGPRRCWPLDADLVVEGEGAWVGLGDGHGRLQSRRLRVSVSGRRAAAQRRHTELWLPAPDGSARAALPTGPVAVVG